MTFPDTTRYFKTDAYIVASSIQELYDAASAATLTLTGIAPTVAYRLRITLSGADCAGTVTMDGTETLKFTAATTKITTTNLTANALPTVTTANLSCNILIECLTTGGAPIYAETTTLIKVRHEPELVTIREPSGNFTTYNGRPCYLYVDKRIVGDIQRVRQFTKKLAYSHRTLVGNLTACTHGYDEREEN